jgi:hypothetical protein
MVIAEIAGTLVSFPLSADGTVFNGEEFDSTYELTPCNLVYASFSERTKTSKEVARITAMRGGKDVPIKTIIEAGDFKEFVKYSYNEVFGEKK